MEFHWIYQGAEPKQLKNFLHEQGISRKLLAKIKFQGGEIKVNNHIQNVLFRLSKNDAVAVVIPDEGEHETMLPDSMPIDIVYEDDHLLVVNKPSGIASIPAQYHPNGTMANRVKHYYNEQNYRDRVIHVVTRLDRDTSGLMLFAKHGFAHALLDAQLRRRELDKTYQALAGGKLDELAAHGWLDEPIARDMSSLMKRQVSADGQPALTEYRLVKKDARRALVDITLHSGRTHQIRVHFAALGCALLGDSLYEGDMTQGIDRQALHCTRLRFAHPFTKELLTFECPLPEDMAALAAEII